MPITLRKDRVRLLILLKRKQDISREEFSRQWREYGQVFSSFKSVENRVLKYQQVHASDKYEHLPSRMGLTAPEWDGVVIIDGPDYPTLFEVFQSQDYLTVGIPNEEKFIDRNSCQVLPVDVASPIE